MGIPPKEAVQGILLYAMEKYNKDPALYHHDPKIAVYGVYMEVVMGIGEELEKIGKGKK